MMRRARTWSLLIVLATLLARRYLDVVEVRGRSMVPTLRPGDRLLAIRLPPRAGDIVLAPDPRDPRRELIKRAVRVDRFGIVLHGDNPASSTDARAFGAVPTTEAAWRVVLRYWPLDRAGPVPPPPIIEGGIRLISPRSRSPRGESSPPMS